MNSAMPDPSLNAQSAPFRVCPSCHRWYRDASNPWWIDRCGECSEASRTRSARSEASTPVESTTEPVADPSA